MKLPRFIACLLLFMSFLPFGAAAESVPAGSVELASSISREATGAASRSASRTAPLQIAAPVEVVASTTTTAAPVITTVPPTTAPPTTAAPVTTTTAKPRPTTVAPAVAEAPPAVATGVGKEAVVQIALAQVGKSYIFGATGPNAFDCSGLVFYAFNQAGIKVPRLNNDGYLGAATRISRSQLQPGDLIFGRGHIGIFVGNGMMVDASTPRGGVKHRSMDTIPPLAYGRL